MSEKLHQNYGDTEEDFRGVNSWTLMALLDEDYRKKLSPEDVSHIEKEVARRESLGIEEEDDGGEILLDLVSHGFGINQEGQFLYPNDEMRKYIANGRKGEMPHRETLKERAEKIMQSIEIEKEPSAEEKANIAINSMKQPLSDKHLQARNDLTDAEKKQILREEQRLTKRFEAGESNRSLFVRASEPLVLQVLGSNPFQHERFSRVYRATKYDDYAHSTDLVYEIESPAGDSVRGRKLITMSVDVTTAETDNDNRGVAEKFNDSGYNRGSELPWSQEITCCGWLREARTVKLAPHFIIGLSESTIKEIANSMRVNDKGRLEGGQVSKDIEFMVTSELWEEAQMQKAFFTNNPPEEYKKKILQIEEIMKEQLLSLMELGEVYEQADFDKKYKERRERLASRDHVYRRTIIEAARARQRQEKYS